MAQDIESRLALQAARGIAALGVMADIRLLADTAQAERDRARLTLSRQLEAANETFVNGVMAITAEYERKIRSLAVDDDDYGEELED